MTNSAALPCIVCGTSLDEVFSGSTWQPSEGTSFATYGHYGSTFWDSFNGEELMLSVCDECLKKHEDRLARHKRYRVIRAGEPRVVVGRQWIVREPVPYFEGPEDHDPVEIEVEEIGTLTGYDRIEWVPNWEDQKRSMLLEQAERDKVEDEQIELVYDALDKRVSYDRAQICSKTLLTPSVVLMALRSLEVVDRAVLRRGRWTKK